MWASAAHKNERRFRLTEWIAAAFAAISVVISAYVFWRTELGPYRILIPPPAVTQANDELPSIIIDVALCNMGAKPALLTDLTVRGLTKTSEAVILHAQKLLRRESRISNLPIDQDTMQSVFLPVLLRRNESAMLRVYCAPFADEVPLQERAICEIEALAVDVWVNGKERKNVFLFPYPDYCSKFKGGGVLEIPPAGFAPRWYRRYEAVKIRGKFLIA